MILLIFCVMNILNAFLYFTKKYNLFILLSLVILFIEPVFQKLLDSSLFGATFNVFGFDRIKSNLIIIVSYVLILLYSKKNNFPQKNTQSINKYIFIVLFFHAFNILFSNNVTNSLVITIVSIVGPVLFFYILLYTPSKVFFDNQALLKNVYVSVIAFLCIGLVMYNNSVGKEEFTGEGIIRTGGGLWLSNISTQILAFFFPLIFSKIKFRFSNILRPILIILFIILMIISMSRTALIVYTIMLIFVFYKMKRNFIFVIVGLAFLKLVVNFSSQILNVDVVGSYSQRFTKDTDVLKTLENDSRFEVYSESFDILKGNEILGTGISSFKELNTNNFSNAHNIFINVLVERGFVGLILLLLLIFYFFSLNNKGIKLFENYQQERELLKLIRIGAIGFFLIGLSGNDLFVNSGFVNGWATYILVFLLAIQIKKINALKV